MSHFFKVICPLQGHLFTPSQINNFTNQWRASKVTPSWDDVSAYLYIGPTKSPNLLLSPLAGSKNTQLGAKTPNWEQKHPTGSFYVLQKLTDTFLVTLFAV